MKDSYRDIATVFIEDFSEVALEKRIVYLEKGKAHCIFLKMPDERFLLDNWKRITNSVALNYQNNLETSFEKWNIYLFFLISESLEDMNLKYAIENNTFSCRKIVENSAISAKDLIKRHVNNELKIEANENRIQSVDFSYNLLIYNVLKDKKIKKKNTLPEQLNLVYVELITKFKEEEE